ncbi:hypothetical protein BH23VER1_BH23VER1_25140 [soil metagenome]
MKTPLSFYSRSVPLLAGLAGLLTSTLEAADPENTTIHSRSSGQWSEPETWEPGRAPAAGDEVVVLPGHRVVYDVESDAVLRSVRVSGTLSFAPDLTTELNTARLLIQPGYGGMGSGIDEAHKGGHHQRPAHSQPEAALEVGIPGNPIQGEARATIRLHFLEGMNPDDDPAIICQSGGRMDLHGAPMNRSWVKLGADTEPGDSTVVLAEPVTGWRVGDSVVVTGGPRSDGPAAEERRITRIDGTTVALDEPLANAHWGGGEFRSEIANLSRNVIVESADPDGVRGHTMYHWGSGGSISYARFASLGKEGVLGRYPIHYHLVEDSMRGSSVVGAAIVDSHNRWITIHGTQYLVVRDCVGYRAVGHGYFLEDATEVYNLLDRNLAVGATAGSRIKNQELPFDPNDGAGFWWSNGKNTLTRNVSTENEEYGFRYDCQMTSRFDCTLPVRQPDGSSKKTDVRTIPIWRFEDNEAHTEGFYGVVIAANGNSQPDSAIRNEAMLERIRALDWTGPDPAHPHLIRNLRIWNAHYAFRPQSPNMFMENIRLHGASYGIYRPAFENHVYRQLHISEMAAEPFNRGMDDASAQTGKITVDGLTFEHGRGNSSTPLVQLSDNNLSGDAETHFRNVEVIRAEEYADRWPLINRGGGPRVPPMTPGVPIFLHDYLGAGQHVKVASLAADDLMRDGSTYEEIAGLTGDEARAARVQDVNWPELLPMVDDEPPATIILSAIADGASVNVRGLSHDNGDITAILVNGQRAEIVSNQSGVVDWQIRIDRPGDGTVEARAQDAAGNAELTGHRLALANH